MRLIDVDALLKKSVKLHSLDEAEVVYTHNILIAPVIDAVEVVFCKYCQYRETTNCITPDLVNDDDYCSYGKRGESEVSE